MRELKWQERPNKKARLSGRRTRSRDGKANAEPKGDAAGVPLPSHGQRTTATKRSQPVADSTMPKKMKRSSDCNDMASSELCVSALPVVRNDGSEKSVLAVADGPSGQRFASHSHRNRNSSFKTPAVSASLRAKSSPYSKPTDGTAQQRRQSRERETEERRLQKIKTVLHTQQQLKAGHVQSESAISGNENGQTCTTTLSAASGARPKEPLEGCKVTKNAKVSYVEQRGFSKNAEGSGSQKGDKDDDQSVVLGLVEQEPETQNQSGTHPCESQPREGDQEVKDSQTKSSRNELVSQLMNDYADSQTLARNLQQVNEQYAEKIDTLNMQLTLFETRYQEDKLRTETLSVELRQLRGKHAKRLAGMNERIEAFEKRHLENQGTITDQQQQLTALSKQLEQTTETRRLELDQFEKFKLDSQRELASQQENLVSCQARLERLRSVISRQRGCLECSICLGLFFRPLTLGCGHTFCETCIETNRYTAVLPDNCPLCRRFIQSSMRPRVVSELVELTHGLEQCHV